MTIIRVLAAATIAGSVCTLVGVLAAPSASATTLAEGSYTFTFDGTKRTTGGKPDPMHTSMTYAGIRSACPPAGCVATALEVWAVSQSVIPGPLPNTWVYHENNGQWEGSRPRDFDCNGDKVGGTETQSFNVLPDGTLAGVDTKLQAPCPTEVIPFTAKRTSPNLPSTQMGQTPADPNTA
jgi:hypothetical protein